MDHSELQMSDVEYKEYHESFMRNNHGSTAAHTFMCIFFTVQCSLFCAISTRHSETYQIIYEYVIIVLSLILASTLLANYIYILNFVIFIILLRRYLYSYPKLEIKKKFKALNVYQNNKICSLTCMRGLTYLITVLAILAVDFKSFPRHLAKTENYGYSFMDTGVGLFVLMSGLVHKDVHNQSFLNIIKSNFKFVSILLLLGVARFVSIKQLNYQEHVTEYGVHWNFFFTLAVCKLVSTIILSYTQHALLTSIVLLALHEYLLYIGLEGWVFSDTPRTNFVNANKEGITSSLGYVTMYLFAAHLRLVLSDKTAFRYQIQAKLLISSLLLWFLTYIVNYYRPTSRALANAGYCIFLEAILLQVITIMYFLEAQFQDNNVAFTVPIILSAVNDNGLIYFLLSNLCTGAINLSRRTMFTTPYKAFFIHNMYMILNIIVVIYLKKKKIRI